MKEDIENVDPKVDEKKVSDKKPPKNTAKKDNTPVATTEPTATDKIAEKLQEFGIGADVAAKITVDLGIETVDDLAYVVESDLIGAGIKSIQIRKLLASFASGPASPTIATALGISALNATSIKNLLPSIPDDESWLKMLIAGGVLKVNVSTVMSAARAAFAYKIGLYDVPAKIVAAMDEFAEVNEESVDPAYYEIKDQLIHRSYAEIFSAIKGMNGSYVTKEAKKKFFNRMDSDFFPSIIEYYGQLKCWYETWAKDPANFVAELTGRGNDMLSDTSMLRSQGENVANSMNKAFSGTGVQIVAALAYDASEIKKIFTGPDSGRLPALVGAASREQMLKKLGIAISSSYARFENDLTVFVLGVIQAKDQTSGNEEIQYLKELYLLGRQIPWDQLGGSLGITPIGGNKL